MLWGEMGFLLLYGALIFLADGAQNESEGGLKLCANESVVILRKEFIQALREPRMRFLLFFPPMLQLVVFGFAVNLDVDHARIAWMDMDRTPESRDLRGALRRLRPLRRGGHAAQRSRSTPDLLDRGTGARRGARAARLRARIWRAARRPRCRCCSTAPIPTPRRWSRLCRQVIAAYSNDVMTGAEPRIADHQGGIRGPGVARECSHPGRRLRESRVWFNPDLYSRNYFVPGVAANILMMVTLMLTSLAIIREKEIGTMEQLMVTPDAAHRADARQDAALRPGRDGQLLVIVTGGALLIFHVPFRGSFCCCSSVLGPVPDDQPGRGTASLDHFAYAAAGQYGIVLFHHAGVHAKRLRVSRSATCRWWCSI